MGQGTAIGTVLRGDISKLRRCRKTLRRGRKGYERLISLEYLLSFIGGIPPGASQKHSATLEPGVFRVYGISVP